MKRQSKWIALAAVLAISTAAVTGCGSTAEPSANTPSDTASVGSEDTTAPETESAVTGEPDSAPDDTSGTIDGTWVLTATTDKAGTPLTPAEFAEAYSIAPDAMDVRLLLNPDGTGTIYRNGSIMAVEYVLEERTPLVCLFTAIDDTVSTPNTPTEFTMRYDAEANTLTYPNDPDPNTSATFTFTKALEEPVSYNSTASAAE